MINAGGVSAGTIYAKLKLNSTLDKDVPKAQAQLQKLSAGVVNVGIAAIAAGTAIGAYVGKSAISAGSDLEEMYGKFDAVFKENSKDVEVWADTFGDAVGRNKYELMSYASTLQDTFVPMGFARDEGAELSEQLTELAVDLASFNNEAEPETIAALQSALVGNHETLRRYGIVITQTTLNQELMKMGIMGGVQAATEQEKVLARLNIIMAGTSDAQGDAARTAGSFANQTRGLKGKLSEMMAEAGKDELPELTETLKDFDEWGKAGGYEDMQQFFEDMAGAASAAASATAKLTKGLVEIYDFYSDGYHDMTDGMKSQQAEFARAMLASGRELDDQQRAILEVQAAYGMAELEVVDFGVTFEGNVMKLKSGTDEIVDDANKINEAISSVEMPGWAGHSDHIRAELDAAGIEAGSGNYNISGLMGHYGMETPAATVYTGTSGTGSSSSSGESATSMLSSISAGIDESNRLLKENISAIKNIKIPSGRSSGGFGSSGGTGAAEVTAFKKYQTIVDKVGGNITGGI